MATKEKQAAFNQHVIAIIESAGAERLTENSKYQYAIETKAGMMELAIHEPERSAIFSIYCIFHNIDQAKIYLNKDDHFNRHTGKWIWHSIDANMPKYFEIDLLNLLN